MVRFIGGSVLIIGLVSGFLYIAGYWNGHFNLTVTDKGKQVLSDMGDKSKSALSSGLDSLQKSVSDGVGSAKNAVDSER